MSEQARNTPCALGRELGSNMVRLTQPALDAMAAAGVPDERCSTCAFRPGTLPNGCLTTVADAMKCGLEGRPFFCHDRRRVGEKCHGWLAMRIAMDGETTQAPWKFADEYGPDDQAASVAPLNQGVDA